MELAVAGEELFDARAGGQLDGVFRAPNDFPDPAEKENAYVHGVRGLILPCRAQGGQNEDGGVKPPPLTSRRCFLGPSALILGSFRRIQHGRKK
jgi:hypothetical protein